MVWISFKEFFEDMVDRLGKQKSAVEVVDEQPYALKPDGTLGAPVRPLLPQWEKPTLELGSLSGLVNVYVAAIDGFPSDAGSVGIHIVDYKTVELISLQADEYGRRHVWARARHKDEVPFKFNEYYQPEKFLIDFRSSFLFNDEAIKVVQVCSTLSADNSVKVSDDGVSQEIVVTVGAVSKGSTVLPADGIPLIPWRTFRDASPVESKFLLRMKNVKDVKDALPTVALFEIDAMWKLDSINNIAHYLKHHLPDGSTIIT